MRVVRERAGGFPVVRVYGQSTVRQHAVAAARTLDRPVGRNGGLRDPIAPRRVNRSAYATVAFSPCDEELLRQEAADRGYSLSSFLGAIVEGALRLRPAEFDRLIEDGVENCWVGKTARDK